MNRLARGVAIVAFLAVEVSALLLAPSALADDSVGAGFHAGGNGVVGLYVNNWATSATMNRVDVLLPSGTTLTATPSGDGTCSTTTSQSASCTFSPGVAPGDTAFVLMNVSGAPASVTVTADFSDGGSAQTTAGPCPAQSAITAMPATLPSGTVGWPYSQQLTGTGGTAPYHFGFQGQLPPGLTLSRSGLLSGKPTDFGTFSFQLVINDTNGCPGGNGYSVNIDKSGSGGGTTGNTALKALFFWNGKAWKMTANQKVDGTINAAPVKESSFWMRLQRGLKEFSPRMEVAPMVERAIKSASRMGRKTHFVGRTDVRIRLGHIPPGTTNAVIFGVLRTGSGRPFTFGGEVPLKPGQRFRLRLR